MLREQTFGTHFACSLEEVIIRIIRIIIDARLELENRNRENRCFSISKAIPDCLKRHPRNQSSFWRRVKTIIDGRKWHLGQICYRIGFLSDASGGFPHERCCHYTSFYDQSFLIQFSVHFHPRFTLGPIIDWLSIRGMTISYVSKSLGGIFATIMLNLYALHRQMALCPLDISLEELFKLVFFAF